MSLRLRLTLTYSLLVALILGVFGAVLYATMRQSLETELDRRLQVRAAQVELTLWPGTRSLAPEDLSVAKLELAPLADLDAPNVLVQIVDRDGRIVATSDSLRGATLPVDAPSLGAALAGRRTLSTVVLDGDRTVRILAAPIAVDADVVGVLEVGQSRQPLQETMAGLRTRLLLLGAIALLVAALVGWLVAHTGLRPLSTISAQAAAIAAERDFRRRLNLGERQDEVGQLARTVDSLLATVEDTLRTHREFVADTSHELRNPLLALRTNVELLDRLTDRAARAECRQEARQQVERMSRLVSDLLVLAQVEAGQLVERRPVALRPLVERVAREARARADGQRVGLAIDADVELLGDEDRLAQALDNLVDNALRHTPPGATVTLRLEAQESWARLIVADSGEGIAAEHLPHVFERFYRADKARARPGGGSGLGLAIVKHLAEAHGGRVTAESAPGQGSRFTIWLPLPPGGAAPPATAPAPPVASSRRAEAPTRRRSLTKS